ncbi:hypothetical protein E3N88_28352 [Mikania micrantha]|uniref:Uncharacterized protein n=1 Tax=Mikania micrantha TaxID=192012 RepID=A0A5N6MZT1_9ASTR|nr:hypothetical protein E3N88_28352 [Mikania micrantha]
MDLNPPPGENYANPRICFFHVLFKAGALAFYILSALFFDSFVIIFVVTVLLSALDFWVVKNVSGRILVGLRWWNEIDDNGESVWKFECLDQEALARMNKKDSWLFWWTLYLTAVVWIFFGIFSLIRFQADYLLVVGVCLTLSIANIVGFTKCRKASGETPSTLAEFTLTTSDFYDVSLVDGFNLPMSVRPVNGHGNCSVAGCISDLRQNCPSELSVKTGGRTVACRSACDVFNTDEYCCRGVYGNPVTCQPTYYSKKFKNACPTSYSYAYDDPTSIFTCSGADYVITFCGSKYEPSSMHISQQQVDLQRINDWILKELDHEFDVGFDTSFK